MKGWSYYLPKGRKFWCICGPKNIRIYKQWDTNPLYSEQDCDDSLDLISHQIKDKTFNIKHWHKGRTIEIEKAWEVYQQQVEVKDITQTDRERIFQDFILPHFKGRLLSEIEEEQITEWWLSIPKRYALSYRKLILARLRAFFEFHPVTRKKRFRYPDIKLTQKSPEWLTRDEQEKRLAFIPTHDQLIFRFLQTYGCRVSEACNIDKTADIDREKNLITFRERKNAKENTLPLFDDIKAIIGSGKITHLRWAFCSVNGKKYSRQVVYRIWADACKRGGFKPISLKNATRTSLVCQWLNRGEPPVKVARMVGDAVVTILKYYTAITLNGIEEAHRASLQE
jgi:integrase